MANKGEQNVVRKKSKGQKNKQTKNKLIACNRSNIRAREDNSTKKHIIWKLVLDTYFPIRAVIRKQ